jgi:hypothetical protein
MIRIISALLLIFSSLMAASSPSLAEQGQALELAEGAPTRHIVLPGDTLWDIAAKFLKEPYRWPEIWRLNQEEIKNPQRIYPGQVVILDRSGERPQLKIAEPEAVKVEPRVYTEDNRVAISSFPHRVIAPFLSQPLVIEVGALDQAPRIVATQDDRVYVAAGNLAYATGVRENAGLWQIYRPGKTLVDPETKETLGIEALSLGSARLVGEGEPASFEIVTSSQEIGRGDRLLPATPPAFVSYAPHPPDRAIEGRIIAVHGGIGEGGRHAIVVLSRGQRDGLEVGHVLAIYRKGREVTNRFEGRQEYYQLPDERYGLLMLFRVFDRVSYALVMNVTRPVVPNDLVRTPGDIFTIGRRDAVN